MIPAWGKSGMLLLLLQKQLAEIPVGLKADCSLRVRFLDETRICEETASSDLAKLISASA
jgi:hypothetical protein